MTEPLSEKGKAKLGEHWLPCCWVLAAFLVASARLFESGLSLDPAIYSVIARNFARNHEWWSLSAGQHFFPQFYEHPFLAFWLQGWIFRIFGASDFTSRLLGVALGSLSFYYLFRLGELLVDRTFAHILAFLTLLSIPFVGRMATFYLEIPLVFFSLGSLYHGYRGLLTRRLREGWRSGAFLAAAFLTKGLAALPLLGTLGCLALFAERGRLWRARTFWFSAGLAVCLVAGFARLQAHYGAYSFWDLYIATGLFGKALRPGMRFLDPLHYFWELVRLHPVHCLVALAVPWALARNRNLERPVSVGLAGTLLFGIANGMLGKILYHYFYPVFPFLNLLTAAAIYPWVSERPSRPWHRYAIALGLIYQVIWNLLPLPMRRKPFVDFYQFRAPVAALRKLGVGELQGVGITDEWIYPAMSLWYWDIGTKLIPKEARPDGPALVAETFDRAALEKLGYRYCMGSSRYSLFVTAPILEACQSAILDPRSIR